MLRITFTLAALLAVAPTVSRGERPVAYETHVRPILKAHCFHCHGEDGEKEGDLDLRLRRFIIQGGDSGPAVEPGDADSILLERVRSGEMPPGEDKRLSDDEIAIVQDWIMAGAPTAEDEPDELGDGPLFTTAERSYWAFQPVKRPAVPAVADTSRVRTPVDAFLLAELERAATTGGNAGMFGFADDADRPRLIRRAAFDLLGLPPTVEDVAEFDNDHSPDAWEKLVDRLLASPHYGERWGRHWLDVAGYADSEGYTDEDRIRLHAFRYRDYVIRSFNADKPFDQFIQEQLAGDEMIAPPYQNLTPEAAEKLAATGFLRMAPDGTASGGIDHAVARNQVVADTMQIVGTSLLGLTIHCAQCHDHRYDPIPQVDYYRLRAIFEPALDVARWRTPAARQISLYTDADRQLAKEIEAEAAESDRQRQVKTDEYITRTLEEELQLVPAKVRDPLRAAYRTGGKDRTDEQVALLGQHPSVANISAGSLYLYDRRREERAQKLDAERREKEKQFVAEAARRELEKLPAEQQATVQAALAVTSDQRTPEQRALLAQFPGVLVTVGTLADFNPEAAAELDRDKQAAAALRGSKAADDLKRYSDQADEVRSRKPLEGFVRALTEIPAVVPETFVFHRGDHEQPRDRVTPGELSILNQAATLPEDDPTLPTTGRRLAWARHLTDGRHPLLARVIVNRVWLHHFGQGLVRSPADFGTLGDRPTHPELLDWLAAEFVESGWSMKHLHRLILASTAYRQSSRGQAEAVAADPENHLYGRFPLRRLEAEVLRDAVLAVSGTLNKKQFGEPVPVMEDEVGQIVLGIENLDGERKPTAKIPLHGEEFRRSVYVQVRRTRPLSVLDAFDAPAMAPNCEQRSSSTVAPQSLMLMNSEFAVEYSETFAAWLIGQSPSEPREQIARGWLLAFAIRPTPEQIEAGHQFLETQRALIRQQSPEDDESTVARQALATFCQALLSSNRFLYVD